MKSETKDKSVFWMTVCVLFFFCFMPIRAYAAEQQLSYIEKLYVTVSYGSGGTTIAFTSIMGGFHMNERLQKQLDFALEIDKEKNILRQTHLSGHGRRENDAEHAWHMAVMAYLLKEYANEKVNIGRVMILCLIHDIVEIDAGDTYAYDAEGLKTQKEREEAAKERIFSLLPEDQKKELSALFDEFEANETPESRFAHAMDNLQPLMLNNSNGGGDWREHQVTAAQVYGRQSKTKDGSVKLFEVIDEILQKHIRLGNLLP